MHAVECTASPRLQLTLATDASEQNYIRICIAVQVAKLNTYTKVFESERCPCLATTDSTADDNCIGSAILGPVHTPAPGSAEKRQPVKG